MMKVLFCGDILSNFERDNYSRSGIYFVAASLLKEFCNTRDLRVAIYCSFEKKPLLERFLQSRQLELDIITLKPLLHRRLMVWFTKQNEKRKEEGLKPLRGRKTLSDICFFLDKFMVGFDAESFQNFDVFFSPCEAAPYVVEKSGIPIYIIIHDLIPIVTGEFPVGEGYWLYDVLKQVSPEKHYFCISDCTKQDFLRYCPTANPKHVKVTYNGYEQKSKSLKEEKAQQIVHDVGLVWNRYILILGNVVPHKNVERQINASVRFIKKSGLSDFKIAIVGSVEKKDEVLERAQVSDDDRDYIVFCGYVPDDHIEAYYTGAFCLSFTSLYEGFGLPALEAMSVGCPVITSNTSSLPEVVGDAAICIPPEDINAHIEAYTRLWNDQELRNEFIERGKKRVTNFRWDMTAKQMIDEMRHGRTV